MSGPLERLNSATSSDGAPSARNLLVTVFGDALLPHGRDVAVSVRSLATLLEPFGVSERLVRTSLSRLVHDEMLSNHSVGRRSFYGVAERSLPLFKGADARIYGSRRHEWDQSWTIVVVDGTEGTAAARSRLRQRLTWAGLGVVAPNVMASPVVTAAEAALIVEQAGAFRNVFVGRSQVYDGAATIDEEELARRCAPLDQVAQRYGEFVDVFDEFDAATLAGLEPVDAFKLRTLVVATYRRIVLVDPLLPEALLPEGWAGAKARALAAFVYSGCADASERHLGATIDLQDGVITPDPTWLYGRFVVD